MPLTQRKFRIGPGSYNLDSPDDAKAIIKEMVKRIVALEASTQEARQSRLDYMSQLIAMQARQIKELEEKLLWLEEGPLSKRGTDAKEKQSTEQSNSDLTRSGHGAQTAEPSASTKK